MVVWPAFPEHTLAWSFRWLALLQLRRPSSLRAAWHLSKPKVFWWHRLLGLTSPTSAGPCFQPYPRPVALFVVIAWRVECTVRRFLSAVLDPPPSKPSDGGKEPVLHFTAHTGLGDLLTLATLAVWAARKRGMRKVVIDWRNSSYLSAKDDDLFERLFDTTPGQADGVELLYISQVDDATMELVPWQVKPARNRRLTAMTMGLVPWQGPEVGVVAQL